MKVTAATRGKHIPPAVVILLLAVLAVHRSHSLDVLLPWNDDVLGLIVFKADLHDPNQLLSSWNENDQTPCNWTGVTCSPLTNRVIDLSLQGFNLSGPLGRGLLKLDHLESLSLTDNNLTGSIPSELQALASLKNLSLSRNSLSGELPASLGSIQTLAYLDLSYNSFTGNLPSELFSTCKGLRYVGLSGNGFDGKLPESIGSCKQLVRLSASENRLSGPLPSAIGYLTKLKTLELAHNSFSGELPYEMSLCTLLTGLDLGYNLFTGELPSFLQSMSLLTSVNLLGNSFTGSIPTWMGDFAEMKELELGENDFHGTVPESLGSMKSLERLSLRNNNLQGGLPLSLSGCFKLASLDLSSNNFTGEIPEEVFQLPLEDVSLSMNRLTGVFPVLSALACKSLRSLDFSQNLVSGGIPGEVLVQCVHLRRLNLAGNLLSGHVPEEVGMLPELVNLDVSNNFLTGYIPRSFGLAGSLQSLLLDGNSLVGIIPEELGNCSSLEYLDLSSNNLTGSIPVELSALTTLQSLDLSHNHLTGQIPASFGLLQNLSTFNVSYNSLAGPIPTAGVFPLLDPSSYVGNVHLCGASLSVDCPPIPKPIVLNPNATSSHNPIISSSSKPTSRIVLSVSAIVAISAAAVIALGIVVVSLLNFRTHARPRASFYVVDSLPGSSPSEDLAIGKLVMFTDDSDSRDEDLLPTAQALLNKNSELGRGGFGTVYKATLAAGKTVAVKKLSVPGMVETQDEFEKRVQFLGKIQHENLVTFQGYYFTPKLQLLIYDFVPAGDLYTRLHDRGREERTLSWEVRFKVALGTALGLAYLHHKCKPRVIHYNVKSSNVLLDEEMNARVSDYGLAKLLHARDRYTMMNKYQAALGYMAPECACESFKVTEKCDVFGYGVILLELITGRTAVEYMEDDVVILSEYVRVAMEEGKGLGCVDVGLRGMFPEDEVLTLIKLGLVCTSQVPSNRPSMSEVVQILELIKPLGDNRSA